MEGLSSGSTAATVPEPPVGGGIVPVVNLPAREEEFELGMLALEDETSPEDTVAEEIIGTDLVGNPAKLDRRNRAEVSYRSV